MQSIDNLRNLVCHARYFCAEFPPSREQRKSACVNCGDAIHKVCLCGVTDLPVMCKKCYDVLKFSFGVQQIKAPTDVDNDEKLIVSSPRNITRITSSSAESIVRYSQDPFDFGCEGSTQS